MDKVRRCARVLGATAVLVFALGALPCASQETLLERWTLGHLAESWSPRWGLPESTGPWWGEQRSLEAPTPHTRISASLGGDLLSLGESLRRDRVGARVELRTPLSDGLGLRIAATNHSWGTATGGDPVLTTSQSGAIAVGLDYGLSVGALGRVVVIGTGGWDNGPGGGGAIESTSAHHGLVLSAWRTTARSSQVVLPADSLRDMGVGQEVEGGELRVTASVPVRGLELRTAAEWRREVLTGAEDRAAGFLLAPAEGSHTQVRAGIGLDGRRWGGAVDYRERTIDLRAPILRVDASAGSVRRAPMELWGWRAAAWHRAGSRSWSLEGGSDRMSGEVSARIETWPFVSLWESLSAQAYRFNGDVAARSAWIRLRSQSTEPGGWSWGAEVGRYRLQVDRDSWYVTSLGFGRSERVQTIDGADPAVFVGGEFAKSWSTRLGTWGATLAVGVPVYGKSLDGSAVEPGDGLHGYMSVMMDWAR